MPEAAHAGLVSDRFRHRLAERDADVLDRVVRIDVQVALRLDIEVEHRVARDLVEHVLEEGQAGGKLRGPLAVQVHLHPDLGFLGVAGNFSGSHCSASRRAVRSIRFSSGVPTVTRRQLRMPGLRLRTRTFCCLSAWWARSASGTRIRKKLASEGNTVTPSNAFRASSSRRRSERMRAACSSSTSSRSSMNSAAACVSTLTL